MNLLEQNLEINTGGVTLAADLVIPQAARGVVLFAHGSGSSRRSPRNRYVAGELQRSGLITVLADLLTPAEEQLELRSGQLRFDIGLLAARVSGLADWLAGHRPAAGLLVGLFGASTAAAAALVAAAERPGSVAAVVSRGGRPDLAGGHLRSVTQPTLLIVGELDTMVIDLNRAAMRQLAGEARLEIVPGASHLFEEAGTLEQVARLATDWFIRHLKPLPKRVQVSIGMRPYLAPSRVLLACALAGALGAGAAPRTPVLAAYSGSDESVIAANWTAFFNPSTPVAKRITVLQDGQQLAAVIASQASSGLAAQASAKVTRVTLVSPAQADVTHTIFEGGRPALANQTGIAVKQNRIWKAGAGSLGSLLALEWRQVSHA